MLPQIGVNGKTGGRQANDPRWQQEHDLGEIQALLSEVSQLSREIQKFTLYHDPLNPAEAFDQVYSRAIEAEQLTVEIRDGLSAVWVELIRAIREERR